MKPFDRAGEFRPEVQAGEIRKLAMRGAGTIVLSGGLGLTIQVASTVVLARLLLPRDFGLVALVSTFSLLLMNVGHNGFTEAILRWERIDRRLISNLFWISASTGVVLTVLFSASGRLLERLYHDPLVPTVTAEMSLAILLSSFSVQHLALLRRAMRLTAVSGNDIVSRIASVAVAIVLARRGWGYQALVAGVVTQALMQTLGAWCLCRWIPSLPGRAPGTRALVSFAMSVYGRFSINYFSRNVDNLLVGWRFGATPLGFYKKAYDLFALSAGQLTGPLTNVAVATLSRFNPRSEQYKQHLLGGLAVVALVGMGLSGALTVVGANLVLWLLGPGWEPTAKIFTYFAPGVGAIVLYYVHGWIHLSIGRADRWLRWGIVESAVTFLCFLVALPWGPVGIAVAWTASLWLLLVPAFWYALRPIQIELKSIAAVLWRYIVAAPFAACAHSWIVRGLDAHGWVPAPQALLARIVSMLLVYAFLYLGIVAALHGRWPPLPAFSAFSGEALSMSGVEKSAVSDCIPAGAADLSLGATEPLVSILIPAYNAESWIEGSLRSALAQTWDPKEIIVVDDGSTDRTLSILKMFESDKVRVVTQGNQGAAAARNRAFALSRGEYIQWLDADDLLAPDKIALQMAEAKKCQDRRIVFTCAFGMFANRYYRAKFTPTGLWQDLSPAEWLLNKMNGNVYMQTDTWLVSRELTQAAGPWDNRLLVDDDGEYFCRLLLMAESIRFVREAKAYYRLPHRNSLSYIGDSSRKREAQWISMQLHVDYLRSIEDSDRTRAACVRYLQHGASLFYAKRPDILFQAQTMAKSLGGELVAPTLPRKYTLIRKLFGLHAAERARVALPTLGWALARFWDKILYKIESTILFRNALQGSGWGMGSEPKGSGAGASLNNSSPARPSREADPRMLVQPKDTSV